MDCKYRKKLPNEKPALELIIGFGLAVFLFVESIGTMFAPISATCTPLEQELRGEHQQTITVVIEIPFIQGWVFMRFFVFCRQAN